MERRGFIGSSDIAAIVGLSPHKKPIDVWQDKVGISHLREQTFAMELGHAIEPVIASLYEKKAELAAAGLKLVAPDPDLVVRPDDSDRAWMGGHPDRLVCDSRGVFQYGLELKNVGFSSFRSEEDKWGEDETDKAPRDYIIQTQWLMSIFNCERWDIAANLHGSRFGKFIVNRNQDLIDSLREAGRDFWHRYVLTGEPPPVDESESYSRYLKDAWPTDLSSVMLSGSVFAAELDEYAALKGERKRIDTRLALLENIFRSAIGQDAGILSDKWQLTYKQAAASNVTDWEALALSFSPDEQRLSEYCSVKPGSRRLHLSDLAKKSKRKGGK